MKRISLAFFAIFLTTFSYGQVSGNINYQTQVNYPDQNINIGYPSNADLYVSVKGMANVKADSYVAIFNVTQVGKTTEEVNKMIDTRISQSLEQLKLKAGIETLVDMISFVPVYEYEVEKKTFSKKTYNEIPVGFELKKNIHIKYSKASDLNEIIAILSNSEIYDLVRVDYFSNNLEAIKKDIMARSKVIMQEKLKNYQAMLGDNLETVEKQLLDGFRVVLPVEMYKSYQAFNSSSLNLKKAANSNQADKSTTLYYQPIVDKEFDFVINPTILEPVIQVMYEVKLKVNREKKAATKTDKEYILVTPNGDLKELKDLNLNKPLPR